MGSGSGPVCVETCEMFYGLRLFSFVQVEEDEKLKKRKERFGILTAAASAEDVEVRWFPPKYRIIIIIFTYLTLFFFQAKKRKRSERFGNV